MRVELKTIQDEKQRDTELRRRVEAYLDAGNGCCILREPEVAACIIDTWFHFDGERYRLLEWVVMPNHCHVLIEQLEGSPLGKIVLSWKNFTARFINGFRTRTGVRSSQGGQVWQWDYWDRFVRNERHLEAVRNYIVMNPVRAGLVTAPEDWPWSSAAHRWRDGQEGAL
jgi:putative transposase